MGSDKLFHKRKAKTTRDLARRKPKREAYEKVLIVCEGSKTEPKYFEDLKDYYALNTANVEISGECGSDPCSVVGYAKQRYREARDARDPFDRVYCVIDKDAHAGYQQAIDEINQATPNKTFFATTSVPCFEYWLLLHFEYTTRPYMALPGNSAGNQILTDLKTSMPDYEKGQKNVFSLLAGQLEFAKTNATRAMAAALKNYTDNPSTRIHELVDYLQKIKEIK